MCQRDSKCELRAMKEMVARIVDKRVVLLIPVRSLEAQVVPGLNATSGGVGRGEGEDG